MENRLICHKQNSDFTDALASCLSSGLSVWLDGVPQTGEILTGSLLLKEEAEWVGSFLKAEDGSLLGISFTDARHGNTLPS
ncbi:MAG: hypothetical protein J5493_04055 [Lachnospiraceae bacterium]|nr:hypothetical protein [Lachnospiraceae bacterium]